MLLQNSSKNYFDKIHHEILIEENKSKERLKCRIDLFRDNTVVLSSKNVNRHLFEAEVQLINALQNIRFNRKVEQNNDVYSQIKNDSRCMNLSSGNIESSSNLDSKAIIQLPNNAGSTKRNSELISQIVEIRKLKYHKHFEEFHQFLGLINKKSESLIREVCQTLNNEMSEINAEMKIDLQIFNLPNINNLSRNYFDNMKGKMKSNYDHRRFLIEIFNKNILKLESHRIIKIQKLISKSTTSLTNIGHLPPSEVHRIINAILIEINLSVIENNDLVSDIRTKLDLVVIEEDRKTQNYINNQLMLWQNGVLSIYLEDLKHKIEKEITMVPMTIDTCLVNLNTVISKLSIQIQSTLTDIKTKLQPDLVEKENLISKWNDSFIGISNEFGRSCETFLKISNEKLEDINQIYLNDIKTVKEILVNHQIYDNANEGSEIVDNSCLPLLGILHLSYEKNLRKIEIFIEEALQRLETIINKINNFVSDLWNLWKSHESLLKKTETSIYQNINIANQLHQEQNLGIENEFNVIIDKMRQDPNEQSLKESFKKCTNLLDKIKSSYTHFYNQQINRIQKYPTLAGNDVIKFENDIICYFKIYYETHCNVNQNNYDKEKSEICENNKTDIIGNEKLITIPFDMLKISESQYFDLLNRVESNFMKFIKNWHETVEINTNKIMAVKIDELNSELKLRYHLHEPRYKRIEYDIRNVRATELMIHSERVSKQSNEIEILLNNITKDYNELERNNKVKHEQLKEQLSIDGDAYLNITNNSKLFNMKILWENRNTEYMNDIRISLREFRKNIETKMQILRQSNIDFVYSFKLFSVGGNFCMEEVEEFTRKIEVTNRKIDDVEGEILSNLENIEKQQHDSTVQFQNLFEDKFKYHIIDNNFLEKINRSFYNIQLKIQTEVSNSNSQSQIIYENLQNLKNAFLEQSKMRIQNIETNSPILKNILISFDYVHDRCIYLDCKKTQTHPKMKSNVLENTNGINTNKVQFCAITVLSKGGKQPNEDVGIKTIKKLLLSQNNCLSSQNYKSTKYNYDGLLTDLKSTDKDIIEKTKTMKDKSSIHADNKDIIQKGIISRSTSVISESITSGQKIAFEKSKLVNKNQRLDKKYLAFGDECSRNNNTFLTKIRLFIKETLDGILYAAELYYRNKGIRKVTLPNLQDNFDQAAEDIIVKLKCYFKQAEDYYSECLQEFNKQLIDLEKTLNLFPEIMYSHLMHNIIAECNNSLEEANEYEQEYFKKLFQQKLSNHNELRSDFGQPNKVDDLEIICANEKSRQDEEFKQILKSFENKNNIIQSCSRRFVEFISNLTEELFLLMDNIVTTDDVNIPIVKEELINIRDLINTQMQTRPRNLIDCKMDSSSNKTTWFSHDLTNISADNDNTKLFDDNISKCFISSKQTSCHITIMDEKSIVTEKFKTFYFEKLDYFQMVKDQQLEELANVKIFWNDSIQSLLHFQIV